MTCDVVDEEGCFSRLLSQQARFDTLTGLANRRHFMMLAEQELSRATRYEGQLSILMMDIDHFKKVNDTYGHHTGDLVLQQLGTLCRETLHENDVVGRIGGEEFAIVLPETAPKQANEAAERLRRVIAKSTVPLEHGMPLSFTVSIGIVTLFGRDTNVDTLLGYADEALYEAKRNGRNRICVYAQASVEELGSV